jgi:hypothetical protein
MAATETQLRTPPCSGASCFWAVAIAMLVTSYVHSEHGVRQARELLHEQHNERQELQHRYDRLFEEKLELLSELAEAQAIARAGKEHQEVLRP